MNKRAVLLGLLASSHLLVDALCIGILFSLYTRQQIEGSSYTYLIMFYNIIAFGIQPIIGYIADSRQCPKLFAIVGMTLPILSLVFLEVPIIAVILLSVGNAFFHVGGGIISLYSNENKAKSPGLFVAPGAIGVFLAPFLQNNRIGIFIVITILFFHIIVLLRWKTPVITSYSEKEPIIESKWILAIIALLFVICVRAIIGGVLVYKWNTEIKTKSIILFAVVLGKAMGGILGDRFGFRVIGVGGLILSVPLLLLGVEYWYLGVIGLFVFNVTMPITLTTLAIGLKRYKGFAFGLTTLALVIGYVLQYIYKVQYKENFMFMVGIVLFSAISLFFGIGYIKNEKGGEM